MTKSLMMILVCLSFNSFSNVNEYWDRPDWSEEASIKVGESRSNIYDLDDKTLKNGTEKVAFMLFATQSRCREFFFLGSR